MAKGRTQSYYDRNPEARKKKRAYDRKYNARPSEIKRRSKRNKDRAAAVKAGRVKKGDGKDLDHVNGLRSSKTVVKSASANRGRKEKSRLKGSKRKKRS